MKIKLYHGTSSHTLDKIKLSGFLQEPYLTSCSDQAEYYANEVAEEDNSTPTILVVTIDTSLLLADLPSFDEPLTYILDNHDMSEEEWHEAIDSDDIPYPTLNDWKTSLEYVFSVKAKSSIPFSDIDENSDLSDEDLNLIDSMLI